jgi:hypothetical protein
MKNDFVGKPEWVSIDCSEPIDPHRKNVVIKFEEMQPDQPCYILIHKSTRPDVAYQLTFIMNNQPASHYSFDTLLEAIDSATGIGSQCVGHRGYRETERINAPE